MKINDFYEFFGEISYGFPEKIKLGIETAAHGGTLLCRQFEEEEFALVE